MSLKAETQAPSSRGPVEAALRSPGWPPRSMRQHHGHAHHQPHQRSFGIAPVTPDTDADPRPTIRRRMEAQRPQMAKYFADRALQTHSYVYRNASDAQVEAYEVRGDLTRALPRAGIKCSTRRFAGGQRPRQVAPGEEPVVARALQVGHMRARRVPRRGGVPVHDDRHLFEMLNLEGAQAGLSWITVLKKRANYKRLFDDFDARKIARYDARRKKSLLKDEGIIRNRRKGDAVVANAKAFLAVQKEFGSFDRYIWGFVGGKPIPRAQRRRAIAASEAMSRDLAGRGFKFVGTICYAFMQASECERPRSGSASRVTYLVAGCSGGRASRRLVVPEVPAVEPLLPMFGFVEDEGCCSTDPTKATTTKCCCPVDPTRRARSS